MELLKIANLLITLVSAVVHQVTHVTVEDTLLVLAREHIVSVASLRLQEDR